MSSEATRNNQCRKCTDLPALIILGCFMVVTIIYCTVSSDITILTKDRDDCGNICGEMNPGNMYDQCGPHDKTNQSKVLAERHENMSWVAHYSCINECPGNQSKISNHCWLRGTVQKPPMTYFNFIKDLTSMLTSYWWEIFIFCPFAFIFFEVMIILLKFVPKTTLWVSHISFVVTAAFLSFFFVAFAHYIPWWADLSLAIFLFVIFEIGLVIWFGKRMKVVAKMLNETTRTMLIIPWITLVPVVTFLVLTIVLSAFLFTSLLIETSRTFVPGTSEIRKFQLTYEDTQTMKIMRILNLITFTWLANFILNCQHFIVAGSVSKWYFTRDKSGMGLICKSSVINLIKYHLGSACFGSIAIPVGRFIHFGFNIIKILKSIVTKLFKNLEKNNKYFDKIDRFLGSFTKLTYIIVERNGATFFESGNRTFDVMLKNLGNIFGLIFFKDETLLICQMMVVLFSTIVGFILVDISSEIQDLIAPIVVTLFFTFMVSYCFFVAYGMIIDTLLVCFCIDCEENDGDLNPYFMINSLKKIVVDIKVQTVDVSNKNRTEGTTTNGGANLNQMYEAF